MAVKKKLDYFPVKNFYKRLKKVDAVSINEFDRTESISIRNGFGFIAIPEVFNGFKVKNILLVVDATGVGTFDWDVTIGSSVESGTYPTTANSQSVNVDYTISTGDKIFIDITGISGVQPVGLTLVLTIEEF